MIRKLLKNNMKWVAIIVLPLLFISSFFMGRSEDETKKEETVMKDYTEQVEVEETETAPLPKKEDIRVPSQNARAEASQVASAFVMAFHAVDAKNPYQYLEDAKPYMTESAFNKYDAIPKRGTLEVQESTPTATDVLPVDLTDEKQIWRVGVTSEENGDYVFTEYQITLIKEGQEWKVNGVAIND